MILLVVEENRELLSEVINTLGQLGGTNEARTASCFENARAAAAKLDHLDLFIATAFSADGENAFALRDELRERFPDLKCLFYTGYDYSDWTTQIGNDPVLETPLDHAALLDWARGTETAEQPAAPAPEPEPEVLDAVPVAIPKDSGDDSQELPVAPSISAPGKRLGDYELIRLIGDEGRTETHFATQLSIDRTVALVLLKPKYASDNEAVREFRGIVRARARVSHPHIAPVYEGYEEAGALFYTRELIDGKHLPDLHQAGRTIDDSTLVEMVRAVAEALSYLDKQEIAHDNLRTRHIYLGEDNQTRLANVATFSPEEQLSPEGQIRYLGAKLAPFLNRVGDKSKVGNSLLETMRDTAGPSTYADLLEEVSKAKAKISERATYNVATTRLSSKPKAKWLAIGAIAAVAVASAVYFFTLPDNTPPEVRELGGMLHVPGGEFVYGNGETATAATFWIDRGEVTISQYADFLDALGLPHTTKFDHADQPTDKPGHQPDDWDNYFDAATRGAVYEGKRIDLNCPVVLVDWWDAHAYAKWLGRRLPTEQEWEKAARGKNGQTFPWGSAPDASKLKSRESGYDGWKPVDSTPGDRGPFQVLNMAANVSEWTATWSPHPEIFGLEAPIIRGSSYLDAPETLADLTVRKTVNDREYTNEPGTFHAGSFHALDLGFRTVSDTDPALAE